MQELPELLVRVNTNSVMSVKDFLFRAKYARCGKVGFRLALSTYDKN